MGAHLVNGAGERVAFKYHPKGEHGPRWALCNAVYWENQQGRGPVYMDVRHLPEKDLTHLIDHLLPVDKKSFGDYLRQKGIDLHKDLLEVEVTGGEVAAASFQPNGINVGEDFQATVPGLFAAGGVSMCPAGLPGSMCAGMAAGESAANFARHAGRAMEPQASKVADIQRRVFTPLEKKGDGIAYWELESKLRQIMSRYVKIGRTDQGLRTALTELDWIESHVPRLVATEGHELMRCLETQEMLAVAKMIARGALVREESRFGLSHYRGDFPETREEWRKSILQTKKGAGAEISFKPAYPLM
jgi:adenylylsulfate reductase subunit A